MGAIQNQNTPPDEGATQETMKSPLSFWSLTLGTGLCVLATIAGSYARFILHTTRLDQNHLSVAAVFPLVVIALVLTRPLKLSRGELIVIFTMALIGATMPTYFIGKLIANFTVPYYLATPENQWANYFDPFLPGWAVMPKGEALRWFFEGLPVGATIPWDAWWIPCFWWLTVIAAFYGCCLCLMVILRKQWVEHERINYPLMEMPLAILEEPKEAGFFRIPIFSPCSGPDLASRYLSFSGISFRILTPLFQPFPGFLSPSVLADSFPPFQPGFI